MRNGTVRNMITLKKMSAEDFAQFREYSVRSYADDLADRRHIPPAQALSPAAGEFISALPCGDRIPRNASYAIYAAAAKSPDGSGTDRDYGGRAYAGFLYGLYVFGRRRRMGVATGARN